MPPNGIVVRAMSAVIPLRIKDTFLIPDVISQSLIYNVRPMKKTFVINSRRTKASPATSR